jgi:hypothetical protein
MSLGARILRPWRMRVPFDVDTRFLYLPKLCDCGCFGVLIFSAVNTRVNKNSTHSGTPDFAPAGFSVEYDYLDIDFVAWHNSSETGIGIFCASSNGIVQ